MGISISSPAPTWAEDPGDLKPAATRKNPTACEDSKPSDLPSRIHTTTKSLDTEHARHLGADHTWLPDP